MNLDANKSLWPAKIGEVKLSLPKIILLQQAEYLAELTNGVIIAEVDSNQFQLEEDLIHTFYIIAPLLNYKFTLFSVKHGIIGYPAEIFVSLYPERFIAQNETSFKEYLEKIFQHNKTITAIESLLAQSK